MYASISSSARMGRDAGSLAVPPLILRCKTDVSFSVRLEGAAGPKELYHLWQLASLLEVGFSEHAQRLDLDRAGSAERVDAAQTYLEPSKGDGAARGADQLALACAFMTYVLKTAPPQPLQDDLDADHSRLRTELLRCVRASVDTQLLSGKQNLFLLAARCAVPETVVRQYLESSLALNARHVKSDSAVAPESAAPLFPTFGPNASALLQTGREGGAGLIAAFGGQGANLVYFEELRYLFDVYRPLLDDFISTISEHLEMLSAKGRLDGLAPADQEHDFELYRWLTHPGTEPALHSLASVPTAAVLIAVLQLSYCVVLAATLNLDSPGHLSSVFGASIGHSQGLITSVALASSNDQTSFVTNAKKATTLLFWMSMRAYEVSCTVFGAKTPGTSNTTSPMVFVAGLERAALQKHIDQANWHLNHRLDHRRRANELDIYISLTNGPTAFVITGEPNSLNSLCKTLESLAAESGGDGKGQSRFSQRVQRSRVTIRPLPVSVPFHHPAMASCPEKVFEWDLCLDAQAELDFWKPDELRIPVFDTVAGSNLQDHDASLHGGSLARRMVTDVLLRHVDWPTCVNASATYVRSQTKSADASIYYLDLGPGREAGASSMINRLVQGTGSQAIAVGGTLSSKSASFELCQPTGLKPAPNWQRQFAPRVVKQPSPGGPLKGVATRFSQLIGAPPVMVAGMTPTTGNVGLVSAVLNAGYHVELASGHILSRSELRDKVERICSSTHTDHGLTLNALYLAPRYFRMLVDAWLQLRSEGYPIQGLTVAGGVPSVDEALALIRRIQTAKLQHISFKPSSAKAMLQIVEIAKLVPDFPIIVQWTGGRAGGHHSNEDAFDPLLSTYASLRKAANIYIVVGGGLSHQNDGIEWLDGGWSTRFGSSPMPVDGILLGTAITVVAEAATSDAVKRRIVEAPGCKDEEWQASYMRPVGGVVSVISEYGEPIHVLANRCGRFWKMLDEQLFSLPSTEQRGRFLRLNRASLIARLNADYQRPWFCIDQHGAPVDSLEQMSYYLVARRFIDLVRHPHTGAWLAPSWHRIAQQLLQRIQERLLPAEAPVETRKLLELDPENGQQAQTVLETLPQVVPGSKASLLLEEDCQWVLQLWSGRGIKPVPFVPALDENFQSYFKKAARSTCLLQDSIWQWENIDVVPHQDPERVLCLVGAVALQHCNRANVGVKELLDRHVGALAEAVNSIEGALQLPAQFGLEDVDQEHLSFDSIPLSGFLEAATSTQRKGSYLQILASAVASPNIRCGDGKLGDNYLGALIRQLMASGLARGFAATRRIEVFASKLHLTHNQPLVSLALLDDSQIQASLWVNDELQPPTEHSSLYGRAPSTACLDFFYSYSPSSTLAHLSEHGYKARLERARVLYYHLWCSSVDIEQKRAEHGNWFSAQTTLTQELADTAANVMGKACTSSTGKHSSAGLAFILGWRVIAAALLFESKEDDLLRLVHRGNTTSHADSAIVLPVGQTATVAASVHDVKLVAAGKQVRIRCNLLDEQGVTAYTVDSEFLFRGVKEVERQVIVHEYDHEYPIQSEEARAVILARKWIHWDANAIGSEALAVGARLRIRVQTRLMLDHQEAPYQLVASGSVHALASQTKDDADAQQLASISLLARDSDASMDPIAALFALYGKPKQAEAPLPTPRPLALRIKLDIPASSRTYSSLSLDKNPLHTNRAFALAGGLEQPVVHGMHTHAHVFEALVTAAADGRSEMIESFSCQFTAPVFHGEPIWIDITHTAMKQGKLVVEVQALRQDGTVALQGTSVVRVRTMGLVFTGQGSQRPGMGTDHMASSAVARNVWERAERHCIDKMGFSLLDIVRNNPKSQTVRFGGLKGSALRKRYMRMGCELGPEDDPDASLGVLQPFFPHIDAQTSEHRFQHKDGLLFQTQFAQVAIAVHEYSLSLELEHAQISKPDAWAGHSAGEFAALATQAGFDSLENLIDIMWFRGLLMLNAIHRDGDASDKANRGQEKPFAMCAVNPSKVGDGHLSFSEALLQHVANRIEIRTGLLCQVVNFNVEAEQYVLSGHTAALDLLRLTLEEMQIHDVLSEDTLSSTIDGIWKHQHALIQRCSELTRTNAVIPLPGISLPFHSRLFRRAVGPLRRMLLTTWDVEHIKVDALESKWIPNVTGQPFQLSKPYLGMCLDKIPTPVLKKLLQSWDAVIGMPQGRKVVAYNMLVEIMAYQICSPVRWTDCQRHLLQKCRTIVELGPSAVLTRMIQSTIRQNFQEADRYLGVHRELCALSKHNEDFFRAISGRGQAASKVSPVDDSAAAIRPPDAGDASQSSKERAPSQAILVMPQTQSQQTSSLQVSSVAQADEILKPDIYLRIVIAAKLKKTLEAVPADATIKQLTGGRSVLTNELISDLEEEFSGLPERAEELPLHDTAQAMVKSGNGEQPGKVSSKWLRKLAQTYLPASINTPGAIKAAFANLGLGPRRAAAASMVALLKTPAARLSEADAGKWIESILELYASTVGYDLRPRSAESGGTGSTGGPSEISISSSTWKDFVERQNRTVTRMVGALQDHLAHADMEKITDVGAPIQVQAGSKDVTSTEVVLEEHGAMYLEGIRSQFDVAKVRSYKSEWAWTREQLFRSFLDPTLLGPDSDAEARQTQLALLKRKFIGDEVSSHMQALMELHGSKLHPEAKCYLKELLSLGPDAQARYWPVLDGAKPLTRITTDGRIKYAERTRVLSPSPPKDTVSSYIKEMFGTLNQARAFSTKKERPRPRSVASSKNSFTHTGATAKKPPVHRNWLLLAKPGVDGRASKILTEAIESSMRQIHQNGLTLAGRNVLLTGAGKNSIGEHLMVSLLAAGARLIVTTSSLNSRTAVHWKQMYQKHAAGSASLMLVPFNAASRSDVDKLVSWIYDANGLGVDLDYVVPFAAISEEGRKMDSIDDVSEMAHRAMLTNIVRLVGQVCLHKKRSGFSTRPGRIILPFSPNHGLFGSDGLYSESKRGLEVLLQKSRSEGWSRWVQVIGAEIGWTRGTGLMDQMNVLAEGFESMHPRARTFSPGEMAFNLMALLHDDLERLTSTTSMIADFSCGLKQVPNVGRRLNELLESLRLRSSITRTLTAVKKEEETVRWGAPKIKPTPPVIVQKDDNTPPTNKRATHQVKFPVLPKAPAELKCGLFDLERTPVIVGFAEVGPYGSARTRWEAELSSHGQRWSIEATVELAFLMGLVKFHCGDLADGSRYTGWIVVETKEPILESEVEERFGELMRARCGIRNFQDDESLTPSLFQRITLQNDLDPVEMSIEEADFVKRKYGDAVRVAGQGTDARLVTMLRGSEILASKASARRRFVGGLIPTGWDATRLGLPQERAESMDMAAVWALVATADAFASAGIDDPYELFKYVHVSQVGNAIGSAMGGLRSCEKMYQQRPTTDAAVQADILQETFVNSIGAWVQLLLLSSSGPVLTPTAACATGAVSLCLGRQAIESGEAKVMICGAFDDLTASSSIEFGNMNATMDNEKDLLAGRAASEASRPFSSSRKGFTEAQGGGIQIVMTANLALQLGLPIYGVLAAANTATDRQGFSIPAPGRGLLSHFADRQQRTKEDWNQILSVENRCKQADTLAQDLQMIVDHRVAAIHSKSVVELEHTSLESEGAALTEAILRQEANLVSPAFEATGASVIRRALAMYGLDADHIGFISCHGTATQAGDLNECNLHDQTLSHLGRSAGYSCPLIAQKSLVGHAKGGAASWAVNGALQALLDRRVPGTETLDDVDENLRSKSRLLFLSKPLLLAPESQACLVTSMGFGQAGAQVLLVSGYPLLEGLSAADLHLYRARNNIRSRCASKYLCQMLKQDRAWLKLKSEPPYEVEDYERILLNPHVRAEAEEDDITGNIRYRMAPDTPHSSRLVKPRTFTSWIEETAVLSVERLSLEMAARASEALRISPAQSHAWTIEMLPSLRTEGATQGEPIANLYHPLQQGYLRVYRTSVAGKGVLATVVVLPRKIPSTGGRVQALL